MTGLRELPPRHQWLAKVETLFTMHLYQTTTLLLIIGHGPGQGAPRRVQGQGEGVAAHPGAELVDLD